VRSFFSPRFTFNFELSTACPEFRRRVDFRSDSVNLRPLSFQSLTNCPRFATLSVPLSFQSLPTVRFSNPLVLTTIRNAGVGVGGLAATPFKKHFNSLPIRNASAPSTFVPRIGRSPVRGLFSTLSTVSCGPSAPCSEPPRLSSSCLPSFPASTAGACGDSCSSVSALNFQPSTLDLRKSFTRNTCGTPSQLFILKDLGKMLSPLESALTEKGRRKSFRSNTYKKQG